MSDRTRATIGPSARHPSARLIEVSKLAAIKLRLALAYVSEQTDLGPFNNCHEKFAITWRYATEANKTISESRYLTLLSHLVMARLYVLHARDYERSVSEAEAAVEMAPNDAQMRSALSTMIANGGRISEAIEWASWASKEPHSSAFAKYYGPNLAWALYLAGRYEDALENGRGLQMVSAGRHCSDLCPPRPPPRGSLHHCRVVDDRLFLDCNRGMLGVREPMNSANLDDLRKAGLPER